MKYVPLQYYSKSYKFCQTNEGKILLYNQSKMFIYDNSFSKKPKELLIDNKNGLNVTDLIMGNRDTDIFYLSNGWKDIRQVDLVK